MSHAYSRPVTRSRASFQIHNNQRLLFNHDQSKHHYGLIVLIPVAIIVRLLAKIVEVLETNGKPLGLHSLTGTAIAIAIALGILLLLALRFVVGALVRSRRTGISFERIEATPLSKVPGYEVLGSVLKGFADDERSFPPVLVNLYVPAPPFSG